MNCSDCVWVMCSDLRIVRSLHLLSTPNRVTVISSSERMLSVFYHKRLSSDDWSLARMPYWLTNRSMSISRRSRYCWKGHHATEVNRKSSAKVETSSAVCTRRSSNHTMLLPLRHTKGLDVGFLGLNEPFFLWDQRQDHSRVCPYHLQNDVMNQPQRTNQ